MSRVQIPVSRQNQARRVTTPAAAVPSLLASALREHQTGRLDEARRLYLEILAIDVRHCDSLHLLGMVEFGAGRPELAVRMIQRAITLRADDASYHSNLGLVLQTMGRLPEAVLEYQQALKFKPGYLEALYNLGSAFKTQGKLAEAASCYERALNLQPDYVEAYNNLGNVYREQAKLEEARACFERALALRPDFAESSNNLGVLLRTQGKLQEARVCLERALTLKPGYAEAWDNLGHTLQDLNQPADAAACFRRVLGLRPESPEACHSLGALLFAEGQLAEAHQMLSKALALNPAFTEAANNLGNVLRDQGRPEEAAVFYERVLADQPDNAAAANNLGAVLVDQGRLVDAIPFYEKALALEPENVAASNNFGVVLVEQGKLKQAARRFDFALALQPDHAEARWNRSLIELLEGDYARGWQDYEARFRRRRNATRTLPQPQWRGQPLNGARIVLHAEQGLGDNLQFLRYVPLVQAAGGRVVLDVPVRLRRLAEQIPGIEALIMSGDPLPHCDWQCPLLSLPLAFGTTVETIPAHVPYLSIPEAALWPAGSMPWPPRGLRVGVAWAGSPSHPNNRFRSLSLAALEPMLQVRGVHFFSLQIGPAIAELNATRSHITDFSAITADMADTAAQMAHLDLIITVDTSVAHLAGALAKPTWVLLPYAPDWRWMQGREDSPWYPTVRLFRQPRMYDWHAVVEQVTAALVKLAND